MSERLPPLNALRAFEAAGRHLSFSRAAAELNVTPGAVSRQVKLLEESLAVRLFQRGPREVTLTFGGREYCAALTAAFADMAAATRRLEGASRQRPLHIFASMMFTMRWLMPRLVAFDSASAGGIRLSTSIVAEANPFGGGDVDAAIYLSQKDWPGMICHRLFVSRLIPICSPALLRRRRLARVEDLASHTLLHSAVFPGKWRQWLAAAGHDGMKGAHEASFGSSSLAYQAAMEGLGVALGQAAFIDDDLSAGRLATPLTQVLEDGSAYILAYPREAARNAQLGTFLTWLLAEAASGGPA